MVSSVLEPALIPFTTSNDELPPPLVDVCRQNLEDVIIALEDIHAKIAILKQDLEALFNRQKEAALAKKACQGLLSPLRKVPNEVIAQVIQASFGNPSCLDAKDLRVFWTFRRVCRRWRGVGLSTPLFWRALHLGPTQISERNLSRKMATWFNRSGIHSPLALTVVQKVPQAALEDLLLDQDRHWVHLNLQVGSPFLNRLFDRLSTQDAAQRWSHARVLELGHAPTEFGPESHLSSNFLNSIMAKSHYFPALQHLSLTRMDFVLSSDTLSNATLSSLCLSGCLVGFPTIQSIIDPRKLPNLQELSLINVSFSLSEEAIHYTPLPHASIRRLVMRSSSASVFLPMLKLPNLEVVTFRSDLRSGEHALFSFLKRSGATIRGICFEVCSNSPAWISAML
ncbi:hypothetical protein BKA70DRAFT_740082 [Coprinopsis sp. MPI-PUGE-AT-0042]|nr:hypothetical protein BKA70DRAFT_740082 [Coprinopsis sp. MPI-PUGE-AT-0042]